MLSTDTPTVNDALLEEVVRRILSVGSPLKIVLFGSHARGEGRPDSDLDLMIVEEPSGEPTYKRATPYRMALPSLDMPVDIIVETPDKIADWANVPLAFTTTVMREGRVLYERPA